jgi:hypothetical protein
MSRPHAAAGDYDFPCQSLAGFPHLLSTGTIRSFLAREVGLMKHLSMVVLVALGSAAGAAEPRPLDRELVRQAPRVIRYLRDNGYENVGVLKFLVSKDGKDFSDNVGTVNLQLAQRLELALILANDPRRPLGIITDASAVAAGIRRANHLRPEGRRLLFEATYPLAWGEKKVTPDAFLTGTAGLSPDLRTLTLSILVFDKKTNKLQEVVRDFTAAVKPELLSEMGESFRLRGVRESDDEPTPMPDRLREKALSEAAGVREGKGKVHPVLDPDAPVRLAIRYDNRPVQVEVRGGRAFVREPTEGEKVQLILRRDGSKERYGVVLKVNGVSTIFRQRLPDLSCRQWILEPGAAPLTLDGFQVDDSHVVPFRVGSASESKRNEVNYGADVGTITLTVFREFKGRPPAPDLEPEAAAAAVVSQGRLPDGKARNYGALKAQLLDDANRGLIEEGVERKEQRVRVVPFTPDPVPVMTLTIVYYTPK